MAEYTKGLLYRGRLHAYDDTRRSQKTPCGNLDAVDVPATAGERIDIDEHILATNQFKFCEQCFILGTLASLETIQVRQTQSVR